MTTPNQFLHHVCKIHSSFFQDNLRLFLYENKLNNLDKHIEILPNSVIVFSPKLLDKNLTVIIEDSTDSWSFLSTWNPGCCFKEFRNNKTPSIYCETFVCSESNKKKFYKSLIVVPITFTNVIERFGKMDYGYDLMVAYFLFYPTITFVNGKYEFEIQFYAITNNLLKNFLEKLSSEHHKYVTEQFYYALATQTKILFFKFNIWKSILNDNLQNKIQVNEFVPGEMRFFQAKDESLSLISFAIVNMSISSFEKIDFNKFMRGDLPFFEKGLTVIRPETYKTFLEKLRKATIIVQKTFHLFNVNKNRIRLINNETGEDFYAVWKTKSFFKLSVINLSNLYNNTFSEYQPIIINKQTRQFPSEIRFKQLETNIPGHRLNNTRVIYGLVYEINKAFLEKPYNVFVVYFEIYVFPFKNLNEDLKNPEIYSTVSFDTFKSLLNDLQIGDLRLILGLMVGKGHIKTFVIWYDQKFNLLILDPNGKSSDEELFENKLLIQKIDINVILQSKEWEPELYPVMYEKDLAYDDSMEYSLDYYSEIMFKYFLLNNLPKGSIELRYQNKECQILPQALKKIIEDEQVAKVFNEIFHFDNDLSGICVPSSFIMMFLFIANYEMNVEEICSALSYDSTNYGLLINSYIHLLAKLYTVRMLKSPLFEKALKYSEPIYEKWNGNNKNDIPKLYSIDVNKNVTLLKSNYKIKQIDFELREILVEGRNSTEELKEVLDNTVQLLESETLLSRKRKNPF